MTWFDIVQVGYVLVVNLSSCFHKDSILFGPFKTQDAYVNEDMLYSLMKHVPVTTQWASLDYSEGLLHDRVEGR